MSTDRLPFDDRTDAGRRLAAVLEDRDVGADLVLAIPRGGLPVGRVVADALGVPLDVVVARKIGAPRNPELAVGAVAADGTTYLNDDLIGTLDLGPDAVEAGVEREREAAREKLERYRRGRPPLDVEGRAVVVVDDGVATGATTIACLRSLRDAGTSRVVLAVPLAPPGAVERLEAEADAVVCVAQPANFGAVGQFYRSFDQVSDEAAIALLDGDGGPP